jgi:hypothetical protein
MKRPLRSAPDYHYSYHQADGRFGRRPSNGQLPSATFDWDRAIEGWLKILKEVYR